MGSTGAMKMNVRNEASAIPDYSVNNPLDLDKNTEMSGNDKIQFWNGLSDNRLTGYANAVTLKTPEMGEGNQMIITHAQVTKLLTGKMDMGVPVPKEFIFYTGQNYGSKYDKFLEIIEKAGYKYDVRFSLNLGEYRHYVKV